MAIDSGFVFWAAVCVGAALILITFSLTANLGSSRAQALRILNRDSSVQSAVAASDSDPGRLVRLARSLTPMAIIQWIDGLLSRAGRPSAWPLERVLVSKILLTAGAVLVVALLLASNASARMMVLGIVVVAVAWATPELLLISRGQERRQEIELALPDAMDQLTIAVEAGLGFEAALAHVARHSQGPLAEEFVRTLQDIQVGQPRRAAYLDLAERTQVKDLGRFIRALNQGEASGISIGRILSTQAREMRVKRRQRAEEKAMQIPVKVVFPLVLCILPVLFIIVMGPAVLNLIEALSTSF